MIETLLKSTSNNSEFRLHLWLCSFKKIRLRICIRKNKAYRTHSFTYHVILFIDLILPVERLLSDLKHTALNTIYQNQILINEGLMRI